MCYWTLGLTAVHKGKCEFKVVLEGKMLFMVQGWIWRVHWHHPN